MNAHESFKKNGYAIIKNVLSQEDINRLYQYTLQHMHLGNMDDGQVPGTPAFYQDKEMAALQKKLLPVFENEIQIKLHPSFCYHRVYRTGAVLRQHKDRNACEISVSLNLGQKGTPWDLWILDYDENAKNITFSPGDAVIYRGSALTHWRGKLTDADLVSQVFFHFVDKHGRMRFALKTELLNRFFQRIRKMMGIVY